MKAAPAPRRTQAHPEESFNRTDRVLHRLGVGRSTLYRMIESGDFPPPRQIGGRSVGWLESEVAAWLAARPVSPHLGKVRPVAGTTKPARPRAVAASEAAA